MRLLHHYPTLSHSFLRNATRLFGLCEIYRLLAVHATQRKKNDVFHNEKDRHVSQRSGLIRKY